MLCSGSRWKGLVMGFRSIQALAAAQTDQGKFWQSHIYKTTLPSAAAGVWTDGSVGAGIPTYNAYIGAAQEFTPLSGARNTSIYLGPSTVGDKYVQVVQIGTAATGVPVATVFCDYLGFYSLIDCEDTVTQTMTNSATLPRYASGDGVQAFAVVQVPQVASAVADVTMTYTNSSGVSGRTATFSLFGAGTIGNLCNLNGVASTATALAPFIPLDSGDLGIRSIQDVTLSSAIGGFINIVLCKPVFTMQLLEQNTVAEKVFLKESGTLPALNPSAFLQFLTLRGSSTSPTPFRGYLDLTWE